MQNVELTMHNGRGLTMYFYESGAGLNLKNPSNGWPGNW